MRKFCDKCWGSGRVIDHAQIGSIARRAREASGRSLRQVAHRLGISDSQLSLLERGKRAWTKELYERACRS